MDIININSSNNQQLNKDKSQNESDDDKNQNESDDIPPPIYSGH